MAGLFYYLPGGHRTAGIEDARAAGLGYAFEKSCRARGCQHGPDGGQGVVIAEERSVGSEALGYFPDKQTWRRLPGTAADAGGIIGTATGKERSANAECGKQEAWVGYFTESRPTPEELARGQMLPGKFVALADGQEYLIPIARGVAEQDDLIVGTMMLPGVTSVDDAGNWMSGGVVPRYSALWDAALRWWDLKNEMLQAVGKGPGDQESVTLSFDLNEIRDIALVALQANYRIGKVEVGMLGLFDEQVEPRVCDVLVDFATFMELARKKAEAGG